MPPAALGLAAPGGIAAAPAAAGPAPAPAALGAAGPATPLAALGAVAAWQPLAPRRWRPLGFFFLPLGTTGLGNQTGDGLMDDGGC